uniref:Uncharacterized protein n=1 Tax=Anguilla anguilla TaxID=7936 RepID=A0A0E9W195_ANGAN
MIICLFYQQDFTKKAYK